MFDLRGDCRFFRRYEITPISHVKTHLVVRKESNMLWPILVILLILWYLGLLAGFTMGGVIHILLVIAITMLVVRLIQEKKHYNYLNAYRRR
jgi:hypothetical protein